jgi:hypothetical protein
VAVPQVGFGISIDITGMALRKQVPCAHNNFGMDIVSQHLGELGEKDVAVVGVLDRELALLDDRIEI